MKQENPKARTERLKHSESMQKISWEQQRAADYQKRLDQVFEKFDLVKSSVEPQLSVEVLTFNKRATSLRNSESKVVRRIGGIIFKNSFSAEDYTGSVSSHGGYDIIEITGGWVLNNVLRYERDYSSNSYDSILIDQKNRTYFMNGVLNPNCAAFAYGSSGLVIGSVLPGDYIQQEAITFGGWGETSTRRVLLDRVSDELDKLLST